MNRIIASTIALGLVGCSKQVDTASSAVPPTSFVATTAVAAVAPVEPPRPTAQPSVPAESGDAAVVELAIKRSFDALEDNSAVVPRPLSIGGDYLQFDRDARCGFLSYESSAGADDGAYYILCKGQAVAGPLTTNEQIRQVTAALAAREGQRHQMMQNIIAQYPTAAAHYRVYDQGGVLVREQ